MQTPNFSISTLSLTGSLGEKLDAIRAAGFDSVELGALDLSGSADGVTGAVEQVRASGIRIAALQEVRDFGGHSGRILAYKLELAKSYLQLMRRLNCRLLIVTPATSRNASADLDKIAADLRTLATLAIPRGIRIGFKPLAWSPSVNNYHTAWELLQRTGNANLGLVLDSYQLMTQTLSPSEILSEIPISAISLVQLSDFAMSAVSLMEDQIDIARHHRLYPGEGVHGAALKGLVSECLERGYSGDFVFDVYNDKYLSLSPQDSIAHATQSRDWLLKEIAG